MAAFIVCWAWDPGMERENPSTCRPSAQGVVDLSKACSAHAVKGRPSWLTLVSACYATWHTKQSWKGTEAFRCFISVLSKRQRVEPSKAEWYPGHFSGGTAKQIRLAMLTKWVTPALSPSNDQILEFLPSEGWLPLWPWLWPLPISTLFSILQIGWNENVHPSTLTEQYDCTENKCSRTKGTPNLLDKKSNINSASSKSL
jgi:hypothetical protein